ncbi:MAG: inner membrane CreD family protein, partial [Gammaproteobacteria bacterium]|nr:inner membrane CreD family protein [Gammaproteobacteria bacterium]
MNTKRVLSIILIFFVGVAGWFVLGSASLNRSFDRSSSLDYSVQQLWGQPLVQSSPVLTVKVPGSERKRDIAASENNIKVNLNLTQRRKGLIWYPTYVVDFSGTFSIANTTSVPQNILVHFPLPSHKATYENVRFRLDGVDEELEVNTTDGIRRIVNVLPGKARAFTVEYRTRGLRSWHYKLASVNGRIKNLVLEVKTNFENFDFPQASLSPMRKQLLDGGATLTWKSSDLITQQDVGVILPEKLNPGSLSARMSFFAPVCLLFFFVLITAICVIKKIQIHPMHYLFVNAGFFAFHLIFAYFVDVINVHLTFVISSIVSVVLVVSYLSAALGKNFPWKIAALGQLFYLVLFSYSFFLKGVTGLTITVVSVITLAILMKLTARTDWNRVFATPKVVTTG